MTLEKVNKIKGFLFVDKINRLLLYQRFKALIFKKHFSNDTKRFLWVILRLFFFEKCFFRE
ncbi:peptidase [Enterococcus faecalis]|nr:peptidase [Enterococcus faecalis]NRE02662.1 peptidase [Enterococcus faecalis]NRE14800.1 peptidase [Enterococcus faecalis]NRE19089.1 peptidase [Enterococcus faecalis]NRE25533.1 peptidase [Enterococcus faecalis]